MNNFLSVAGYQNKNTASTIPDGRTTTAPGRNQTTTSLYQSTTGSYQSTTGSSTLIPLGKPSKKRSSFIHNPNRKWETYAFKKFTNVY